MSEREEKWTNGPWRVFMSTDGFHMIGIGQANTGQGVTDCGFGVWGRGDAESLANAQLIAAAPALYEALEACINTIEASMVDGVADYESGITDVELRPNGDYRLSQARDALRLARGDT